MRKFQFIATMLAVIETFFTTTSAQAQNPATVRGVFESTKIIFQGTLKRCSENRNQPMGEIIFRCWNNVAGKQFSTNQFGQNYILRWQKPYIQPTLGRKQPVTFVAPLEMRGKNMLVELEMVFTVDDQGNRIRGRNDFRVTVNGQPAIDYAQKFENLKWVGTLKPNSWFENSSVVRNTPLAMEAQAMPKALRNIANRLR